MLNDPKHLIDFYISLGFDSIFLRPVNYMGFARKNFKELSNEIDRWNKFYEESINYIIKINENKREAHSKRGKHVEHVIFGTAGSTFE